MDKHHKKLGSVSIFALLALAVSVGVLVYASRKQETLGATILSTQLTDTIGTFRTNVNTSLDNLNNQLGGVSSTLDQRGILYNFATSPSDGQFFSASGSTPTWKTLIGSAITITNSPTSTTFTIPGSPTVSNTTGTFSYTGASLVAISPTSSIVLALSNPNSVEDDFLWTADFPGKITKVTAVHKTHTDTVTFNVGFDPNRNKASSSAKLLFTSYQTVTATTTPVVLTANGSTTFAVGDVFRFFSSAASSTEFDLTLTLQALP